MKEDMRFLIELQGIDSVILKRRKIIDLMPSKVSTAEQAFKEVQSQLDRHKQKHEMVEKKKKEKERQLEDVNEKLKKVKARTSEIKTNKEYQAHLKEIESVEKERYAIEDDILAIMEEIDSSGKELKAEEAKAKTEKGELEAFKKKVEEEISEAEKELAEMKAKHSEVVKKIDAETFADYMTLLEACRGLAVVEARDEICQGCNMNIPPQMFVEIKKNEEIIQCPQCRRILYWKEKNE